LFNPAKLSEQLFIPTVPIQGNKNWSTVPDHKIGLTVSDY